MATSDADRRKVRKLIQEFRADSPWVRQINELHEELEKMRQKRARPKKSGPSRRQLQVTLGLLQQVLDHVSVGRLKHHRKIGQNFHMVQTNQGNFLIAVFPDRLSFGQLEAEQADIHEASRVFIGEIERILIPDFSGKLRPESSYVHLRDHYFSIYQLQEKEEHAA
jgi:hypothetical protein